MANVSFAGLGVMRKKRLDMLVVEHGFAENPEQAERLIRAGEITVAGQRALKPGHKFSDDSIIEVAIHAQFVGRGGEKLEGAFNAFDLDVKDLVCMDIGSATGGFTDCLLQHGAAMVYAVDVGKGLLDWKLRNDPRVVVMEEINARYLDPKSFEKRPEFVTIDVSFISLTKILPAVKEVLDDGGHIITLIKPQFEADRKLVGKGGVIRDANVHKQTVESVKGFGTGKLDLRWLNSCESPLKGPAGNVEFLAYWSRNSGR